MNKLVRIVVLITGSFLLLSACMVGPAYRLPVAPAAEVFKEQAPAGWKEAQPNDAANRGDWWRVYGDPQLDRLEEKVSISNQNVLATEAQYRAARAAVR